MSPVARVATCVLHYRGLEDTRRCLRTLQEISWPEHRILLVDGSSDDGSLAELIREFPQIPRLELEENLGYAGGNNRGMRRLLEEGADFLQIVNPDVEVVEPDYVARLVEAMDRHPDWGLCGPRVFFHGRDRVQKTWHEFPSLHSLLHSSRERGGPLRAEEAPAEEMEVEVVNGVCLFLRAGAVDEVGGFDEDFFLYAEEMDLCRRMLDAGWKAGHVPAPSLIHHAALQGRPFDLTHNLGRSNQVRFLRKHHETLSAAILLVWLAASGFAKKALRPGRRGLRQYLRLLRAAWSGRPARSVLAHRSPRGAT